MTPSPHPFYTSGRRQQLEIRLLLLILAILFAASLSNAFGLWQLDWQALSEHLSHPPSDQHWLGTNALGQDIFSRLIQALLNGLLLALVVSLPAIAAGAILGIIAAGNIHRWPDFMITTLLNVVDALPIYFWAALMALITGGSITLVAISMALVLTSSTTRIVRAATVKQLQTLHVTTAKWLGLRQRFIIRHHLLPALRPVLLVQGLLVGVTAIKTEAVLGFLGLSDPHFIGFGTLLAESIPALLTQQYLLFGASATLFTLLIGFFYRLLECLQQQHAEQVYSHA